MLPLYEIRNIDLTTKRNCFELTFPEHIHKYIEFIYVNKGSQRMMIDNVEYTATEGNGAIVFPNIIHSFPSDNNNKPNGSDILIVMCDPKLFGSLYPNLANFKPENPIIDKNLINTELKTAFNAMYPTNRFELNFSWCCVIMSYILEILELKSQDAVPIEDITFKIINHIEKHFTEPITRASIAKDLNVSECYISKVFAQKIKLNLRNYLGHKRAEYAANLIRTTDETFTTISRISGFDSLRTFNRMFKMAYGKTPQEYKHSIGKTKKEQ